MDINMLMELSRMASKAQSDAYNSTTTPFDAVKLLGELFSGSTDTAVNESAAASTSSNQKTGNSIPQSKGASSKGASGVLGLFSDISSMFSANNEHAKYADEIMKQRLDMPAAIQQAKEGYQALSQGLPGYEVLRQRAINNTPRMLTQFEQLGSTNQILAELSKAGQRTGYMLDTLNMENENQKLRGNMALLNFMSSVEAPMQTRINEFNISKKLAAAQERMLGAKEGNQAVENVTSDLVSLFSMVGGGGIGG